jgi:hypothetical protein
MVVDGLLVANTSTSLTCRTDYIFRGDIRNLASLIDGHWHHDGSLAQVKLDKIQSDGFIDVDGRDTNSCAII